MFHSCLKRPLTSINSWTWQNMLLFSSTDRLVSPLNSSESLGAASGTERDIESSIVNLCCVYNGHTKKSGMDLQHPDHIYKMDRLPHVNQNGDELSICCSQDAFSYGGYYEIYFQNWTMSFWLEQQNGNSISLWM